MAKKMRAKKKRKTTAGRVGKKVRAAAAAKAEFGTESAVPAGAGVCGGHKG